MYHFKFYYFRWQIHEKYVICVQELQHHIHHIRYIFLHSAATKSGKDNDTEMHNELRDELSERTGETSASDHSGMLIIATI